MVKDFEIEWNWYLTLQSLHWHYATIRLLGLSLSHSQQWVGPQWATKRILLIDFTAGPACFSHPFPWTFQFTRRHLRIWLLGITWNMKQIEAISFGDQPFTALQICWFCCPPVGAQTKEGGTWSSAISCNLSMRSAVYTCTDRHKICKYALFEKQYVYNMLHIRIYINTIRTCLTIEELRFFCRFWDWDLWGYPLSFQHSGDTIHGRDRHISPSNLSKNVATGATGTTWVFVGVTSLKLCSRWCNPKGILIFRFWGIIVSCPDELQHVGCAAQVCPQFTVVVQRFTDPREWKFVSLYLQPFCTTTFCWYLQCFQCVHLLVLGETPYGWPNMLQGIQTCIKHYKTAIINRFQLCFTWFWVINPDEYIHPPVKETRRGRITYLQSSYVPKVVMLHCQDFQMVQYFLGYGFVWK